MNNKEGNLGSLLSRENEVSPETVLGSQQRVAEIIGLGSGRGFELRGINLPKNWSVSIDNLKAIHVNKYESYIDGICRKWDFLLNKIVFDKNNALREITIGNRKGELSRIFLAEFGKDKEKGVYLTEGLDKIESVMIFQEIMASYLDYGWGDDFNYGYILCNPKNTMGGGFGPIDLDIPIDILESRNILADVYIQRFFSNQAFNIAGRFGLELEEIKFDKRGLLTGVGVSGDRTSYSLGDSVSSRGSYSAHNVDTPYQAAALHTIVAKYINSLSKK